jgi:multiple sugar transport system permease protein
MHAARRRVGRVVTLVLLVAVALASIAPLAWLVRSAFMSDVQIFAVPPELWPDPIVWTNFADALGQGEFGRYFLNTGLLVLIVVPGMILSTSLAAFSLARLEWRGRGVVFGLLMTGLMLPYAVTLIPTFVGWQYVGGVGTYFPLTLPAWFAVGGAFYVFLLRQFFLTIPSEYDQAVYIDGGTPFTVYRRVIMPLSKGPLMLVGIFTTLAVWNDLLNPLIYLNDPSTFTLSLGLASFTSLYSSQWALLMAASLITILPVIVLFAFSQKYIVEGVTISGLK